MCVSEPMRSGFKEKGVGVKREVFQERATHLTSLAWLYGYPECAQSLITQVQVATY